MQLCGCVLLGVGIWLRVDRDILDYLEIINVDRDDPYLDYTAYVIITIGCVIFLIGLCGCCGAYQESGCMLATVGVFFLQMILPFLKFDKFMQSFKTLFNLLFLLYIIHRNVELQRIFWYVFCELSLGYTCYE